MSKDLDLSQLTAMVKVQSDTLRDILDKQQAIFATQESLGVAGKEVLKLISSLKEEHSALELTVGALAGKVLALAERVDALEASLRKDPPLH